MVFRKSPFVSGIINTQCDPKAILLDAATEATEMCRRHYKDLEPPAILIRAHGNNCSLSFIPEYLHYVSFELLKNALRAVVERQIFDIQGAVGVYEGGQSRHDTVIRPSPSVPIGQRVTKYFTETKLKSADLKNAQKYLHGGSDAKDSDHSENPEDTIQRTRSGRVVVGPSNGKKTQFFKKKNSPQHTVSYDINQDGPITLENVSRYKMGSLNLPPICVDLCGDDSTVTMRISDEGGGIPPDKIDAVWSYLFTTAKPITNFGDGIFL